MDPISMIDNIIGTIKNLTPESMDFDKADAWVGCVIGLEQVKGYVQELEAKNAEHDIDSEEVSADA